jgi:Flp pilus assembly pilin Flp
VLLLVAVASTIEIGVIAYIGFHPASLRAASIGTPAFARNAGQTMRALLRKVWLDDQGQDIAEYAVMLAVILVIVVGTIRLVGSQANNVFSETASAIGG